MSWSAQARVEQLPSEVKESSMRFWHWLQDENAAVTFLKFVGVVSVVAFVLLLAASILFAVFEAG